MAGPKLRLVLNRSNTQVKLDIREIEQVLGLRADFPIPADIAVPISVNAGVPVVEVAPRVPVQAGPFGIKASPNGKLIAVAARESAKVDFEGNTISIIDVDRARAGSPGAELARVRVGTNDPAGQARPFTLAWTAATNPG